MNLGLSPEAWGARIGCSGGTIRRAEKGAPLFDHTKRLIAAAMGLQSTDLWPVSMRVDTKKLPADAAAKASEVYDRHGGEVWT